jgi:peptidoglycan/LPS O-acetylase OafA/YrhL
MAQESRVLGLDAARASMMILGVLLHSLVFSIRYLDSASLAEAQILFGSWFTLHTFRMPAFFLLGGFFANLLIGKLGSRGYLRNRLKRIGLVLIILGPVIVPLTFFASGQLETIGGVSDWNLQHLWFLYYLLMISVIAYLISLLRVPNSVQQMQKWIGFHISNPLILWMVPMMFLLVPGILDPNGRLNTPEYLSPDPIFVVYYGFFFLLGVMLHKSGKQGLESLSRRGWVLFAIGIVSAQIAFGWGLIPTETLMNKFVSHMASFYLAFGVIGLFLHFVGAENRVWSYLTRTSYWIYLVHLPIVFAILNLLSRANLSVFFLVFCTFLLSLALSIVSYEVIVRRTPLLKLV